MSFAKPYGEAKVLYPHPFDEKTAVVIAGIPAGNLVDPGARQLFPLQAPRATLRRSICWVLAGDLLTAAIVSKFSGYFGPKNVNPPVPVRLNKAILVAKNVNGNVLGQTQVGNELAITWQDMEVCYPALAPAPTSVWLAGEPARVSAGHHPLPSAAEVAAAFSGTGATQGRHAVGGAGPNRTADSANAAHPGAAKARGPPALRQACEGIGVAAPVVS